MSAQWYLLARYAPSPARPCAAGEASESCCGLIREVSWPYGVRKRRGDMQCWRVNTCADEGEAGTRLGACHDLAQADRQRENRSGVDYRF